MGIINNLTKLFSAIDLFSEFVRTPPVHYKIPEDAVLKYQTKCLGKYKYKRTAIDGIIKTAPFWIPFWAGIFWLCRNCL